MIESLQPNDQMPAWNCHRSSGH